MPEAVLLGLALVGGTLGAGLGIFGLRHKSSKRSFLLGFAAVVLAQAVAAGVWLLR